MRICIDCGLQTGWNMWEFVHSHELRRRVWQKGNQKINVSVTSFANRIIKTMLSITYHNIFAHELQQYCLFSPVQRVKCQRQLDETAHTIKDGRVLTSRTTECR